MRASKGNTAMGNRPSRAERLELVRNKLSRRDFAKYSSLSAVAIAIASRSNTAEARIDLSKLKVGEKCKKFLKAIPENFKASELVYGGFGVLLGKLIASDELSGGAKTELQNLKIHVDKFQESDDHIAPRLLDLYCYDKTKAPTNVKHPDANAWEAIYDSSKEAVAAGSAYASYNGKKRYDNQMKKYNAYLAKLKKKKLAPSGRFPKPIWIEFCGNVCCKKGTNKFYFAQARRGTSNACIPSAGPKCRSTN